MKYSGRVFSKEEIDAIRRIIVGQPPSNRTQISRRVCEVLDWRKPNGTLKDMSCRVALLRMQDDGLLILPPPKQKNGNGKRWRRRTGAAEPGLPVDAPAGALGELHLEMVTAGTDSQLWNEYIDRYHYLGYTPLPGAQIRYFALARGQIVALLSFSAAAWKIEPRDTFVGWTAGQREKNLHGVVNNSRFLILPWIRSKNLATRLLSAAQRQIEADWEARYAYRPVLLETFVEVERFRGTCYKAANWTCVGMTKGRGKLDVKNEYAKPVKSIWLLPLTRDFRRVLCR